MNTPPWTHPAIIDHSRLLADGFHRWTGRHLLRDRLSPEDLAHRLYQAPFVLLSHGTEADPLFNYANLTAQCLWELDWSQMVGMPSRRSAEPVEQAKRAQALGAAGQGGCLQGYTGIRISAGGRRFRILDGIIWTLLNAEGVRVGQAATFAHWEFL
jgi:hypothetical protein